VNQLEVVLYVKKRSLLCWRAKAFLARMGYSLKVVHTTNEVLEALLIHFTLDPSRKRTLPYLFIDQRPVGDFADIKSLKHSGTLQRLMRGEI
jgi:glutaredoxin